MKNLNETMKHLQQTTERLARLDWDHAVGPWTAIEQMADMFSQDFWRQISQLTKFRQGDTQENGQSRTKPSAQAGGGLAAKGSRDKGFARKIPVDIFETLGKVLVCMELAGLDRNSLRISLSHSTRLTVRGKIKEHDLAEYRVSHERWSGKFSRTIHLPCPVMEEGVLTTYQDGLLEIQLSKDLPTEPWDDAKELRFEL